MEPSTRLKVHRHAVVLAGREATVLRLRPSGNERFATNYFHDTWHVLSDPDGARLLGQLCWALSYQRQPGTIVVLHEPELVRNPFDAGPSNTVVVYNSMLAPFKADMATALRAILRRRRVSDGTVVMRTPGLAAALADPTAFWQLEEQAYWRTRQQRSRTWIDRINGCLVLAAPPAALRAWVFRSVSWVKTCGVGATTPNSIGPPAQLKSRCSPTSPNVSARQRPCDRLCIRAETIKSSWTPNARPSGSAPSELTDAETSDQGCP